MNSRVFRLQSRALIHSLSGFRLAFADAPWLSEPGPGIVPVYQDHGPFRRWLRWKPSHPNIDDDDAIDGIFSVLEDCKARDQGTGPWVALLGFSQGAKIAASLLYDQQIRMQEQGFAETNFKFAVLLAGRGPLVSFCDYSNDEAMDRAGGMSLDRNELPEGVSPHVLRLPTVHVHGLKDQGLHYHRQLLKQYCEPSNSSILEWQGDHRVPLKQADVSKVATEIIRVAREQGIKV